MRRAIGGDARWRRPAAGLRIDYSGGATLKLGAISGAGVRSYLCLSGGIQVPDYLGSKSTFTLGQFGGHGGRALRGGDVLHLAPHAAARSGDQLPAALRTALAEVRTLRVIYGPTARRNSLRRNILRRSSPRSGRSTLTPAAPACA